MRTAITIAIPVKDGAPAVLISGPEVPIGDQKAALHSMEAEGYRELQMWESGRGLMRKVRLHAKQVARRAERVAKTKKSPRKAAAPPSQSAPAPGKQVSPEADQLALLTDDQLVKVAHEYGINAHEFREGDIQALPRDKVIAEILVKSGYKPPQQQ